VPVVGRLGHNQVRGVETPRVGRDPCEGGVSVFDPRREAVFRGEPVVETTTVPERLVMMWAMWSWLSRSPRTHPPPWKKTVTGSGPERETVAGV
jgi:hypothetical protein